MMASLVLRSGLMARKNVIALNLPDWSMRMMKLVMTLQNATAAIDKATK